MEQMVRNAYIEGVRDGLKATERYPSITHDDHLQFMWECSDAARDLPETTQ